MSPRTAQAIRAQAFTPIHARHTRAKQEPTTKPGPASTPHPSTPSPEPTLPYARAGPEPRTDSADGKATRKPLLATLQRERTLHPHTRVRPGQSRGDCPDAGQEKTPSRHRHGLPSSESRPDTQETWTNTLSPLPAAALPSASKRVAPRCGHSRAQHSPQRRSGSRPRTPTEGGGPHSAHRQDLPPSGAARAEHHTQPTALRLPASGCPVGRSLPAASPGTLASHLGSYSGRASARPKPSEVFTHLGSYSGRAPARPKPSEVFAQQVGVPGTWEKACYDYAPKVAGQEPRGVLA